MLFNTSCLRLICSAGLHVRAVGVGRDGSPAAASALFLLHPRRCSGAVDCKEGFVIRHASPFCDAHCMCVMLPASQLSPLPLLRKQVVGRQSHAIGSDHPAGGYEEKDTFNHQAECCELVLSEVTVLTSTADPDLEAPRQCQQGCLMHLPVKPSHGDEALETSSQDSLSLTYHWDSHEAKPVK